ncbi:MAG: SpoIIE family protein phosphatase [Eubacterium sp.]
MEIIEKIKLDSKKINFDNIEKPLKCIGYFVLGFVLSTGAVMENLHPFGISITAVSKKRYFIFSALGACLGYIVCGVDAHGARYLAATVMAGLGAFAAFAFDLSYRPAFSMALSFLVCLATGIVLCFRLDFEAKDYVLIIAESILCCGGAFFFYRALNSNVKRLRFKALPISDLTCIVISLSILLLNLSALQIGAFSPARALSVLLILTTLRFGGDRWGLLLALSIGFALSISSSGSIFLVGALAFSAMVAGLFSSLSSLGIGISFLCSMGFFCAGISGKPATAFFIECVLGTVVFILLPSPICDRLERFWDTGRDAPPDGSLRQNLVLKLRFASSAMAAISDSVDQVREKITDITRKENDANRSNMTEEEYIRREIVLEKTNQIRKVASDQFFSIADMLEDLAFEFDEAESFDTNASSKIRQMLGNYEIYPSSISVVEDKYNRIRVEILTDSMSNDLESPEICREIGKICSRYFQNGRITQFKNEAMLSFTEKPVYSLNVGFAQHSAEGGLCGDTVKILNDNKGHSILIISDGMGKGSRAALDGAMGAGLLSKLINAGFGFDSALKVVNSALLVKSNDESLATLDIASIDLFTGRCEIYKAGAPASYIIKNGKITKCELSSMAAGILRGIEFAKRTAILSLDNLVVLLSDGICDLGELWIQSTLHLCQGLSPQQTADFVIESALEHENGKRIDDMSIIVAKLERN